MTRSDLIDIGLKLLGIALAFAILAVPLDGVLETLLTASGGMIALCGLVLLGAARLAMRMLARNHRHGSTVPVNSF